MPYRRFNVLIILILAATAFVAGCRTAQTPMGQQPFIDPAIALEAGRELVAAGQVVEAWPLFQHAVMVGDEGTRRQAGVELYDLGVELYDEDGESCQVVDLSLACGEALYGCSNGASSSLGQTSVYIAFGYEPDGLVFEDDRIVESDVARLIWHAVEECSGDGCEVEVFERLRCEVVFADACTARAATVCEHDLEELGELEEFVAITTDGREVLVFETGWPEPGD